MQRVDTPSIIPVPSASVMDNSSQSSTSSPKSQAILESTISHTSQSTVPSLRTHELTPPSSVVSSQGQPQDFEAREPAAEVQEHSTAGRKRTANGEVKEDMSSRSGHIRTTSSVCNANLAEELRTKLTYAMVKVQNGWQSHCLEEVESLASQSPRSTLSGLPSIEKRSMLSPRVALSSQLSQAIRLDSTPTASPLRRTKAHSISATDGLPRKSLAPPANIVSGARRRATPNGNLQINTAKSTPRPAVNKRTPSQNAAMEADAVETLMFMSASPNNSGHFPPIFSPLSSTFSAQASPLRSQFSVNNSPEYRSYRSRSVEKAALIDRLLDDLDDDTNRELDEAFRLVDESRSGRLST